MPESACQVIFQNHFSKIVFQSHIIMLAILSCDLSLYLETNIYEYLPIKSIYDSIIHLTSLHIYSTLQVYLPYELCKLLIIYTSYLDNLSSARLFIS